MTTHSSDGVQSYVGTQCPWRRTRGRSVHIPLPCDVSFWLLRLESTKLHSVAGRRAELNVQVRRNFINSLPLFVHFDSTIDMIVWTSSWAGARAGTTLAGARSAATRAGAATGTRGTASQSARPPAAAARTGVRMSGAITAMQTGEHACAYPVPQSIPSASKLQCGDCRAYEQCKFCVVARRSDARFRTVIIHYSPCGCSRDVPGRGTVQRPAATRPMPDMRRHPGKCSFYCGKQ